MDALPLVIFTDIECGLSWPTISLAVAVQQQPVLGTIGRRGTCSLGQYRVPGPCKTSARSWKSCFRKRRIASLSPGWRPISGSARTLQGLRSISAAWRTKFKPRSSCASRTARSRFRGPPHLAASFIAPRVPGKRPRPTAKPGPPTPGRAWGRCSREPQLDSRRER